MNRPPHPIERAPRILVLWCPDWPVTAAAAAAGLPAHRPAAVVAAQRVLACSAGARAHGVRRGLRRREAQARCPELVVLAADPARDSRLFEQVASSVEGIAPGVEVVRPGLLALHARGPVGYFGDSRAAAERLIDHVAATTGVECQVGIADGLFAATLAAHRGLVVEPGRSAEFLAALPVTELDREPGVDRAELIDLLNRLGLRGMGAFGRLAVADVASRFGTDAVVAHRLSRGLDARPPAGRRPPVDLSVFVELDPPITRVDQASFASRSLADRLHRLLAEHGLACTRLGIRARTAADDELLRVWRCAEPLTPAGTVDRTRWQLEAWLTRQALRRAADGGSGPETGWEDGDRGIVLLRLSAEEAVPAGSLQLGLWGDVGAGDERAGRALARVQTMLGLDGVCTAVLQGGRGPADRVLLVSWGMDRGDAPVTGGVAGEVPPWPGRLPSPSPTWTPIRPVAVEVGDASGGPVLIDDRRGLLARPRTVSVDGGRPVQVRCWSGPWPVDQRWWDPDAGWRGWWLQVVLSSPADGGAGPPGSAVARAGVERSDDAPTWGPTDDPAGETALLLAHRAGRWTVVGVYD